MLLNKGLTNSNVWEGNDNYPTQDWYFSNLPRGHPAWIDHRTCDHCEGDNEKPDNPSGFIHSGELSYHPESMSLDEGIFIILGCELAVKLVGGSCGQFAAQMKYNIATHMINQCKTYGDSKFIIYEPSGHDLSEGEGGSTYTYGKPLSFLSSPSYTSDFFNEIQDIIWRLASLKKNKNWDYTCSLAAMTDSWSSTGAGITNVSAAYNTETFFTLLWEVLQNKKRPDDKQSQIINKSLDQLNAAPCEGPFCYKTGLDGIYSPNGWAATYKWCKKPDV